MTEGVPPSRLTPPSSERLTMRELVEDDADFVGEMLANLEVMRYYPAATVEAGAATWIARQLARYAADGHGLWLVSERSTGVPVGQVGVIMQDLDGERVPELGYLLHRPFWGRGYATEAARAAREHAKRVRGYTRIVSFIRPDNLPSQAVAHRLGMQEIGDTSHHGVHHLVFGKPDEALRGARASTGSDSASRA